jgi:hypothetical protein
MIMSSILFIRRNDISGVRTEFLKVVLMSTYIRITFLTKKRHHRQGGFPALSYDCRNRISGSGICIGPWYSLRTNSQEPRSCRKLFRNAEASWSYWIGNCILVRAPKNHAHEW